jgi:hypothetical protein
VLFNWTLIFAFVSVALYMSIQMNRDTLLSNLNGTKPGQLNWAREFITRIFLYVVIPILAFLGVQFPDTLTQIFGFLSPGAAGHGSARSRVDLWNWRPETDRQDRPPTFLLKPRDNEGSVPPQISHAQNKFPHLERFYSAQNLGAIRGH